MKNVTFECDNPRCEETASSRDAFGHYGTGWIMLTHTEPVTPYENTQYGLRNEKIVSYYHSVDCLKDALA